MAALRLLVVAVQARGRAVAVGVEEHHAVVGAHGPARARDRERVARRLVRAHELADVERGEDVAVEREEGAVEALDLAQRAGGAERLVLLGVVDADAVGRAVAEHRPHEVGEVAGGDRHVAARRRPRAGGRRCRGSRRSPSGSSGFGRTVVYGSRREPRPPARMTARSTGKAAILVPHDRPRCHTACGCRPEAVGAGLARARGALPGRGAVPVLRLARGVGAGVRAAAAGGRAGRRRARAAGARRGRALAVRGPAGDEHARAARGGRRGVGRVRRLAARARAAVGDAGRRGHPARARCRAPRPSRRRRRCSPCPPASTSTWPGTRATGGSCAGWRATAR